MAASIVSLQVPGLRHGLIADHGTGHRHRGPAKVDRPRRQSQSPDCHGPTPSFIAAIKIAIARGRVLTLFPAGSGDSIYQRRSASHRRVVQGISPPPVVEERPAARAALIAIIVFVDSILPTRAASQA